jgi:hypothetical protein
MAPTVFGRTSAEHRNSDESYVCAQPTAGSEAQDKALAAMCACPAGSIRTASPDPRTKAVLASFPRAVHAELPNVHHLGAHGAASFGAAAYLLTLNPRELIDGAPIDAAPPAAAAGQLPPLAPVNVMVDTPRFTERLARQLDACGGLDWHLLTRQGDVGNLAAWKRRFPGVTCVMHATDVRAADEWPHVDMAGVEIQFGASASASGDGAWALLPAAGPWRLWRPQPSRAARPAARLRAATWR